MYNLDKGDLIELYKMFAKKGNMRAGDYVTLGGDHLRGHSWKLTNPRCQTRLKLNVFSQRVINKAHKKVWGI